VSGANCVLTSTEGTYYVTTPGNVTVHKTKNDLAVVCKRDGYEDAKTSVASHFNGATVGNVIAGGVIGIGIDAATGANYNYPDKFDVPMVAVAMPAPMTPAAAPAAPAAAAPAKSTAGS
jgi:phosphoketolase